MNAAIINKTNTSWWPKFIIAAFILFAFFIGYMVRLAMQTDVDLVSKDYYKKEIAYQQHLNQVKETNNLSGEVTIVQAAAAEQLSLVFPEVFTPQKITGSIHFFRPSDAKLDFEVPVQLNNDRQQHISTERLTKGLWRVQINWQAANKNYYIQKEITIE
ncbi:FixH family protein [Adhaeribacter radiodurans]|uniref:FixH family protein n=1 Tax=Adhaeribacter radiodurans TaxID=2745197 RepID=A0A7L7L1L8_9BACT|nr:FixH family protein [Adhaeribacter radiodurans]QMU26660.1 FixH family protein [Adhaeribacter radiodurans]